jgi:valyl-tRNA synthetase
MSKSKGTGIDPLPVMEEFGTDALRFTLLVGSTPGNDLNLSLKKVEGNRNFANKIWNAGRFVISALHGIENQESGDQETGNQGAARYPDPQSLITWSLADSWIWARLQALVREVERLFQSYQYGEAGRQIYEFFWNDFADWYVEAAKLQMQRPESKEQTVVTLVRVLDICLRMLHPITPFVTEELWGHLRKTLLVSPLREMAAGWPEALIVAAWPEPRPEQGWETERLADFALVQEIIRSIRNLRAEKKVSPAKRLPATLVGGSKSKLLKEQSSLIAVLAGLDHSQLSILESLEAKPEDAIALIAGGVEIYIPLSGMLDFEAERMRLQKEWDETQVQIERLDKLLASDFARKAPAAVVQKERERLAAFRETAEKLKAQLT